MTFLKTSENITPITILDSAIKLLDPKPTIIPDILKPDQYGTRFNFLKYEMSKEDWDKLPSDVQEKYVEEIFSFYRLVWGFPYAFKTRDTFAWKFGVLPEIDKWVEDIIQNLYQKDFEKYSKQAHRLRNFASPDLIDNTDEEDAEYDGGFFDETCVDTETCRHLKQNLLGMGVPNAFMPHLHHTPVKNMMSPHEGFFDDVKFKKAIHLACRWDSGAWPHSIRYGLRSIGGIQSVGNFKPTVAKFLYERYTPDEGGIVYDFSCGWGGRLTGARSSKKNIRYVGVDPSVKTFECLQNVDAFMCDRFGYTPGSIVKGSVSGKETDQYRSEFVQITNCGSEDFRDPDLIGKIDFAFSSPPYFDLEDYASGDTGYENQSHVKFPGRDRWLNGFLKQTADNVYAMLKAGGTCGLNLADFRDTEIVGEAIKVFESAGLKYCQEDNYEMRISVRTGNRSTEKLKDKKHKTETIFIFHKS